MFDRFTDEARRALALSRKEAQRFSHDFIGPEHILLGLLGVGGIASFVFIASGHEPERVGVEIERNMQAGRTSSVFMELPFTAQAKKALERAFEESTRLEHDFIGPEHLLLGVLHQTEGPVTQVIESLGLEPAGLRKRTLEVLANEELYARAAVSPRSGSSGRTSFRSWESILRDWGAILGLAVPIFIGFWFIPSFIPLSITTSPYLLLFSVCAVLALGVPAILLCLLGGSIGRRLDRSNGSRGRDEPGTSK